MKQKLWPLASALALLERRLNFFHGGMEGDGTLGSQEENSFDITSQINHLATLVSCVWTLEMLFLQSRGRACFPPTTCTYHKDGLQEGRGFFRVKAQSITEMNVNLLGLLWSLRHLELAGPGKDDLRPCSWQNSWEHFSVTFWDWGLDSC